MGKKIAILVLLMMPVNLWAADHLQNAKKLTEKMKYKQALWDINQVLKSAESGPEEIKKAYELQGMCLAALGEKKEALISYGHLLAIDIDYALSPRVSPKLRQPFDRARKLTRGKKPITLTHEQPKPGKKIAATKLRVQILGNPFGMVRRIRMRYTADEGSEKRISRKVKRAGVATFKLPSKLKANRVSYYFEALTRQGGVLYRVGNKDKPFRLEIEQPVEKKEAVAAALAEEKAAVAKAPVEKKPDEQAAPISAAAPREKKDKTLGEMAAEVAVSEPVKASAALPETGKDQARDDEEPGGATAWYKTWWFWTAVGVVAAGTATGIALGVSGGGSGEEMRYDVYIK